MAPQTSGATTTGVAKPRDLGLDLLRFAAVLAVLLVHLRPIPDDWPEPWRSGAAAIKRSGWVGVDLFFVLSGFLVAGLIFSEFTSRGTASIGRFLIRRGWKIYPPFYVLLAATLCFRWWKGPQPTLLQTAAETFFFQNYTPGLWGHTWSLAVEEHFYFLLAALLGAMIAFRRTSNDPFRWIPCLAAVVAATCLALRIATWSQGKPYSLYIHHSPSHLRIDSLFVGVALAYYFHFRRESFLAWRPQRRRLIALGLLLLSPTLFDRESNPWIYTIGFSVFAVGCAMLLVGVFLTDFSGSRSVRFLALLGSYSYSIYLWHLPVLAWVMPAATRLWGKTLGFSAYAVIYLASAFLLGVLMAKMVETPALKLRDRWFPKAQERNRSSP